MKFSRQKFDRRKCRFTKFFRQILHSFTTYPLRFNEFFQELIFRNSQFLTDYVFHVEISFVMNSITEKFWRILEFASLFLFISQILLAENHTDFTHKTICKLTKNRRTGEIDVKDVGIADYEDDLKSSFLLLRFDTVKYLDFVRYGWMFGVIHTIYFSAFSLSAAMIKRSILAKNEGEKSKLS